MLLTTEEIEAAAAARKMSISELCRRAKMHPTTFTKWKRGDFPSMRLLIRLNHELDAEPPKEDVG